MATLTKKHTYKNGGASYGIPGIRASIYVGPRMFSGSVPDTIEFGASNLAQPADLEAEKAAKAAKLEAKKAERKVAAEAKAAERKAEAEKRKAERAAAAEAKRAEKALAKENAKPTPAPEPVPA